MFHVCVYASCIFRYNISTDDYDPWNTNASQSAEPRRRGQGSKVSLAAKYGFDSDADARARGYIFKNNPQVKLFGDADFTLQLAVNTAQYGRTFQDRCVDFDVHVLMCRSVLISSIVTKQLAHISLMINHFFALETELTHMCTN